MGPTPFNIMYLAECAQFWDSKSTCERTLITCCSFIIVGIERFFEENTHGILQTDPLTVAIWENAEDNLIYMFDPNKRGITGMPAPYGFACLITFANAKIAADHITACISADQRQGEFIITPVEIVVGSTRTKRKQSAKAAEELERKRQARLEVSANKKVFARGQCQSKCYHLDKERFNQFVS